MMVRFNKSKGTSHHRTVITNSTTAFPQNPPHSTEKKEVSILHCDICCGLRLVTMNWLQLVVIILAASFFGCNNGLFLPELDSDCTQDTECALENSYCNTTADLNQCACNQEYVPEDRPTLPEKCWLKATMLGIPSSCEIPAQCEDLERSQCIAGQCDCTGNTTSSIDRQRCLNDGVLIGQPCEEDQQCVGPVGSSICSPSQRCACIPGWVSKNDNSECLPIVNNLNREPCTEDRQCQLGRPGLLSECPTSLNKCNCTALAVTVPNGEEHKCYAIATLVGSECEFDHQCEVGLGSSVCNDRSCGCNVDYIASTDQSKCLAIRRLEQPCEDNTQCTGENARCLAASSPGYGNFCNCTTGYIGVTADNKCYPLTPTIGGRCIEHPTQCSHLDAVCNDTTKVCQCREGWVENGRTKCLPVMSRINGTCEQTIQCNDTRKLCVIPPGQQEGTCQCESTQYVESWVVPSRCVQIRNELNEQCEEDRECIAGMGNRSECYDGVCHCKGGSGYIDGSCHKPATLGQICYSIEECWLGVNDLSFCAAVNNTSIRRCRCQPGTIEFGQKCYRNKVVGDPCSSNMECTVSIHGSVKCDAITKSCACNLGYSPDAGNTVCTSGATTLNFQFSLSLCIIALLMHFLSTD